MKGLMEPPPVHFGRRRGVEGGMQCTRSLNLEVALGRGVSPNMTWIEPDTLIQFKTKWDYHPKDERSYLSRRVGENQ